MLNWAGWIRGLARQIYAISRPARLNPPNCPHEGTLCWRIRQSRLFGDGQPHRPATIRAPVAVVHPEPLFRGIFTAVKASFGFSGSLLPSSPRDSQANHFTDSISPGFHVLSLPRLQRAVETEDAVPALAGNGLHPVSLMSCWRGRAEIDIGGGIIIHHDAFLLTADGGNC